MERGVFWKVLSTIQIMYNYHIFLDITMTNFCNSDNYVFIKKDESINAISTCDQYVRCSKSSADV